MAVNGPATQLGGQADARGLWNPGDPLSEEAVEVLEDLEAQ
jgi:hypothetical protein